MLILDCQYCGAEFEAERSSRKFCSNSCKTKANTQRRENEFNQYRNEQRQAGIEMEAELQRKWDEQLAAEKAEQDHQLAAQRKQQDEQRRSKAKDKLKKDNEKKSQESEYKSNLKTFGIIAALCIGYQLFKATTKSDDVVNSGNTTKPKPDLNKAAKQEEAEVSPNNLTPKLDDINLYPADENSNSRPDLQYKQGKTQS